MNFMNMFSEEELKQASIDRKKEVLSTDINLELGIVVGERLALNLPTLETDWETSRNVITLSNEDKASILEYEKMEEKKLISFKQKVGNRNQIAKKYLPVEHKYVTHAMNITNMGQFREGLSSAIWGCDHSWYSTKVEDIDVSYDEDYLCLIIKLKLDL